MIGYDDERVRDNSWEGYYMADGDGLLVAVKYPEKIRRPYWSKHQILKPSQLKRGMVINVCGVEEFVCVVLGLTVDREYVRVIRENSDGVVWETRLSLAAKGVIPFEDGQWSFNWLEDAKFMLKESEIKFLKSQI